MNKTPSVVPNATFIENFNLAMNHYQVDLDEAKYEKSRVMKNMDDAERCYSVIAAGVRGINKDLQT